MYRTLAVAFLFLGFAQDPDPAIALVARLRSDDPAVRDEASAKLKALGTPALAELEKAAKDADTEVASRAGFLVRAITIRSQFTPKMLKVRPGIEDRLASGGDAAWTREFLSDESSNRRINNEDLVPFFPAAIRGAATSEDKQSVFALLARREVWFAAPFLIPFLADPDEEVRSVAADVLQDAYRGRVPAEIVPFLKNPDPGVRIAAMTVFRYAGRDKFPQEALDLLKDPDPNVQTWTFRVLVDARQPLDFEAIAPFMVAADTGYRKTAWRSSGEKKGAWEKIARHAESSDGPLRTDALNYLVDWDAVKAVPILVRALGDANSGVRAAAFSGLARARDPSQLPAALIAITGTDPAIRNAALKLVGAAGTPRDIPTLRALLKEPSTPSSTRVEAMKSLVALKGRPAHEDLIPLLGIPETGEVDEMAWILLEDLDPKEFARELIPFVSMDNQGKDYAASLLMYVDSPKLIPELGAMLPTAETAGRRNILDLFQSWGYPEAIPLARPLLADKEPWVQVSAIRALVALQDRASIPEFVKLLEHKSHLVAGAAATALIGWKVEAGPAFRNLLKSPHEGVHEQAIEGLDQSKWRDAVPDMVPLLKHSNLANASAEFLIRFDPKLLRQEMKKLLEDKVTRVDALRILSAVDWREGAELALDHLKDTDPGTRVNAVSACLVDRPAAAMPVLIGLLDLPATRGGALSVLFNAAPRLPGAALSSILDSDDDEACQTILKSLGHAGVPEAVDLAGRFLSHSSSELRKCSIEVIEELNAVAHAVKLLPLLKEENTGVVSPAIQALRVLGYSAGAAEIEACLQGKDLGSRIAAIQALIEFKEFDRITRNLKVLPAFVRQMAAWMLEKPGNEAAAPLLKALADDPDPEVRNDALMSMGAARIADVVPRALAQLKSHSFQDRVAAAKALTWFDRKAHLDTFVSLVKESPAYYRWELMDHIETLMWKEAAAALMGLLGEADEDLREFIIHAAGVVDLKEAAPALVSQLNTMRASIRDAASIALIDIGSREGIPGVFNDRLMHGSHYGSILARINKFRTPDLWDRLGRMTIPPKLRRWADLKDHLQRVEGIRVEERGDIRKIESIPRGYSNFRDTLLHAGQFILEKDSITFTDGVEMFRFFRTWWRGGQAKK